MDWQPIEQAPADGTEVLAGKMVWRGGSGAVPMSYQAAFIDGEWHAVLSDGKRVPLDPQPTHYMPI